ncbi:hypothetical protein AB0F43_20925 [Kribbella sp. NPDC023972]|uniref:hypothetical protein n=1 Tax=Kribbella sp. NPDC023972 TaxID=3154795 RepID=UPI0033DB53B6
MLAGAQLLANASAIATDLGVPPVIIGFTLVALGTSLSEEVTPVQAKRRGESDLVVGTCSAAICSTALSAARWSDPHPARSLREGSGCLELARLAAYALTMPLLVST